MSNYPGYRLPNGQKTGKKNFQLIFSVFVTCSILIISIKFDINNVFEQFHLVLSISYDVITCLPYRGPRRCKDND